MLVLAMTRAAPLTRHALLGRRSSLSHLRGSRHTQSHYAISEQSHANKNKRPSLRLHINGP